MEQNMKKRMLTLTAFVLVIATVVVWSLGKSGTTDTQATNQNSQTAPDTKTAKESDMENESTLLFFMNPNGRPCQIQDSILNETKGKLSKTASLRYVKTTNRSDYELFRKYGIRGLPSLVLINQSGKVIHRFAPGIQNAESIMSRFK
jgi:thioredoxin 1